MKLFFAIIFFCAALFAQPPQGSVSGNLTRSGSGEPIRRAEVTLTRIADARLQNSDNDSPQLTSFTDTDGHFAFAHLGPGDYVLTVRKNGFSGFRGPNSHTWQESLSLTLTPGQTITDLALTLQPGAVIAGKVVDEEGEPMSYVQVNALKWVYAGHHRQLRPVGMATTDDQGSYRVFGLQPGAYVMRANATVEANTKLRYLPDYFPDSQSALSASALVVRAGDEAVADFHMSRGQAAKITGHISGALRPGSVQVYLRSAVDEGVNGGRTGGATTDRNGNFTLEGVLPGDYYIGAMEFQGDTNVLPRHAEAPLKVEGDTANVSLSLEDPGSASLTGTLRVDSPDATHPPLSSLRVGLLPADDSTANAELIGSGGYGTVARDGTITLDKVSPGRYVVSLVADGNGWEDFYTKDVQIGNRDVTDGIVNFNTAHGVVPITVTVGIDGATVDGTVTDDAGTPVANATIIGVPDAGLRSQPDLYQRGETDRNGHFLLRGIKPGLYAFYAFNQMDDESYMDPEFLRRFESGHTDLTLAPKAHETIQLKLLTTDE